MWSLPCSLGLLYSRRADFKRRGQPPFYGCAPACRQTFIMGRSFPAENNMTCRMRALVKPTAAPGLELQVVTVPRPDADKVVIKIETNSLCVKVIINTQCTYSY